MARSACEKPVNKPTAASDRHLHRAGERAFHPLLFTVVPIFAMIAIAHILKYLWDLFVSWP